MNISIKIKYFCRQTHPNNVKVDGSGYSEFNRFAPHYWFVDLDIDCSFTLNGWFDFKVHNCFLYSLMQGYLQKI